MILDAETLELVNAIETMLERRADDRGRDQARADGVGARDRHRARAANTREAGAQLRALRRQVRETAARARAGDRLGRHAPVRAVGGPADRRAPALPRPDRGAALRRAPGDHLRACTCTSGVDDPDKAIHVANGMRVHVPMLLALSANSPFWRADATGLRLDAHADLPRLPARRHPARLRGLGRLRAADRRSWSSRGVIEDYTYLWYDVRPHPNFGTVEIRVMDAQTRVEHTLALAALIQAMVKELAEHFEAGKQLVALPVRDARREQVARRAPRARRRAGRPARARPGRAPSELARRLLDRAARARRRSSARPTSSRASRTCSSTATAPRASWWSTRPTTTCARSWREIVDASRAARVDSGAYLGRVHASAGPLRRLQELRVRGQSRTSPSARTAARGCASARRSSTRRDQPRRSAAGAAPTPPLRAAAAATRSPASAPTRGPVRDRRSSCSLSVVACVAGAARAARRLRDLGARRAARRRVVAGVHGAVRLRQRRLRVRRAGRRRRSFGWLLERRHGPVVPLLVFLAARRGRRWRSPSPLDDSAGARAATAPRSGCSCAWAVRRPGRAARAARRREPTCSASP